MIVLDANILICAYNSDSAEHKAVSGWLAEMVESGETIGLPWVTAEPPAAPGWLGWVEKRDRRNRLSCLG